MATGTGLLAIIVIIVGVLTFLAAGIMHFLFLFTIHRTLKQVKPENLAINPPLLYLDFVPILFFFWEVIALPKASRSVLREYQSRGWPVDQPKFSHKVALVVGWGTLFHWVGMAISAGLFAWGYTSTTTQTTIVWVAVALWLILTVTSTLWMAIYIIYWIQMFSFGKRMRDGWPTSSKQTGEKADYEDLEMLG